MRKILEDLGLIAPRRPAAEPLEFQPYHPLTRQEYKSLDIVDKADFWAKLPRGYGLHSSWSNRANGWDVYISEFASEARDKIRELRVRNVSQDGINEHAKLEIEIIGKGPKRDDHD